MRDPSPVPILFKSKLSVSFLFHHSPLLFQDLFTYGELSTGPGFPLSQNFFPHHFFFNYDVLNADVSVNETKCVSSWDLYSSE